MRIGLRVDLQSAPPSSVDTKLKSPLGQSPTASPSILWVCAAPNSSPSGQAKDMEVPQASSDGLDRVPSKSAETSM